MTWIEIIERSPAFRALLDHVRGGGAVAGQGVLGSSPAVLSAALARGLDRPVLLVTAHLDDADEASDEIGGLGLDVAHLPAMEIMPGESTVNPELLAARLALVRRLAEASAPAIVATSIQANMPCVPEADRLASVLRVIRPGDRVDVTELSRWLDDRGYRRTSAIESAGEFTVRGGIVDVFPTGGEPVRIDLFGDEVESLAAIDLDTMGSDRRLDAVELVGTVEADALADELAASVVDTVPDGFIAVLVEPIEMTEQGRSYLERVADARGILALEDVLRAIQSRAHAVVELNHYGRGSAPRAVDLPIEALPAFDESIGDAVATLLETARTGRTVVLGQNDGETQRMRELLAEAGADAGPVEIEVRYLHRGFTWRGATPDDTVTVVPYHELLNRFQARRRVRRVSTGRAIDAFIDLQPGDFVVHRDHGIAQFAGLRAIERAGGDAEEFLSLEFAKRAKLNVPASKIDLVQKYIGAFAGRPKLSTLGGRRWKRQKEQVLEAVRDLASEMLRLQAARSALPGIRYPDDTPWQREFEAEFPYPETDDQLAAIAAIKRDMADRQPMDRLVCGDVGFGKTEVAIRAAFKAVEYGKQVAVLVPTTVLADQHERTFSERFADYPFRIETISRFKSRKEQAATIEALRNGKVDVVIGTHRLLSEDVRFADLGMVIIDEEQRFGVEHKQKLLSFRATADILTLSATPIPRTLHMSMLGLRDISSLTTAPLDRRAIVTEVMGPDERRVKQAIDRELAREGQIFVVHNRVYDIQSAADDVRRMAPNAKILVGHGQMPSQELEKIMLAFVRGEADILVSTTIIESGIDIPRANTMIIHNAHRFGLAELHQLRGRVGRYKHRAYCYLLLPEDGTVSPVGMKRLRAIESFSMLGAGFKIALRDLEIRGAGNLLGAEQSGHIAAVGYEMYCQLLEQAVEELKKPGAAARAATTVDIGIGASLPKGYIPADARRMDAYRRISMATDEAALDRVRSDIESAYGELPKRAEALIEIAAIRIGAAGLGIVTITRRDDDIVFRTKDPVALESCMRGVKGSLRLVGDRTADGISEVYFRPPKSYLEQATLLTVLRRRLSSPLKESVVA